MATKKDFFKIVVTGPESTGKTAMAEALAASLGTQWVPEFARFYIGHLGRPYQRSDLKMVGLGQKLWEEWHTASIRSVARGSRTDAVLICDTDWTVLHIWETYRFDKQLTIREHPSAIWQQGYGNHPLADLYLLCAPDFPWQPDSLREHPEERDILFAMYESLLCETQSRYVVLKGSHESRLQIALAAIQNLF